MAQINKRTIDITSRGLRAWPFYDSVPFRCNQPRVFLIGALLLLQLEYDRSIGCGICRKRCQVHAITENGEVSIVDRKKYIGCGLCVTGCPNGAAKLERRPESEIVNPPVDFEAWKHERLRNRGLDK